MGALTLASFALPQGWWSDLLQAAAKAGFVGGIADWFAVTALFRHPLGLPIPHTAIIPNQKARLGQALGRFVATHVFTGDEVAGVLRRLDLPGILHRFLADPQAAHPAALALAGMLPKLLATVEDGRARRLMARLVPRLMGGPGAGRLVARALASLVEGGRHQEVLSLHPGRVQGPAGPPRGRPAHRHRGARARAGRPAGGMGARRVGGAARAGNGERRAGQGQPGRLRTARRVRRMGAARDRPHGGGPAALGRDRHGHPPRGGA